MPEVAGLRRVLVPVLLPGDGTMGEAVVQLAEQLGIAGGEVFVGVIPLLALLPAGLRECDSTFLIGHSTKAGRTPRQANLIRGGRA
jgi:hypothetical protein